MTAVAPAALPLNWASFVDAVTLGQDPAEAARALGYADPRVTAAALLRMPLVRKALVAAAEARLEGVAAPLALKVVEEILQDADAPKAVKAKLALGVLDRVRGKDEKGQAGHKTLQDMTVAELASHVRRLEELQAGEANLLDVTPGKQGTGEATP